MRIPRHDFVLSLIFSMTETWEVGGPSTKETMVLGTSHSYLCRALCMILTALTCTHNANAQRTTVLPTDCKALAGIPEVYWSRLAKRVLIFRTAGAQVASWGADLGIA